MSTDVYNQAITIREGTAPTIYLPLWGDDASWTAYATAAGLEAIFVLRDNDDAVVWAFTNASFSYTAQLDADVAAAATENVTFAQATYTNPYTKASESTFAGVIPLTQALTTQGVGRYSYSWRVYGTNSDHDDGASGPLLLVDSAVES